MIIALFIIHELSYDKFNGKKDRIYRVILNGKLGGQEVKVTYTILYRVTGIMKEVPESAHFAENIISSFMTSPRANDDQWLSNSFSTYVLLHPGASPQSAEARLPDIIVKYVGPILQSFLGVTVEDFLAQGNKYNMFLQPLAKIHLDPTIEQAFKPANDPKYLLIFGSIGIMAGSYPAFYLSSFNPYMVLKGSSVKGRSSGRLRNLLVILQLKIPGVMHVSASTTVPGHNNNNNGYRVQGWHEESFLLQTNWVDFDFESLRTRIGPYIMHFKDEGNNWGYVSIRLSPETGTATLSEIEKVWASYTASDPIQYFFMDKDLEQLYKKERQNSKLAVMFTILGNVQESMGNA